MTANPIHQSLEELTNYLRLTLPLPKTIARLEMNEANDAVTFQWQGREFLVRRSLEVFEIRGKQVYFTGASMLMQSALVKKSKNEKVLGAVLEIIRQAEEMINSSTRVEAGLRLLATARASLQKLSRNSGQSDLVGGMLRRAA